MGFVVVRESLQESEAQVIVSLLESEGIDATINEDNAGDMLPPLEETRGVQVLVAEADLARAEEILAEFEQEEGEEGDDDEEGDEDEDDEGE